MGAVLFWSLSSALIFLGARAMGTWGFVAVASVTGGLLQLVLRRVYPGELRSALWLPWRLWAVPVACFVVYGLTWPWALASSTPRQVLGVNLINYLWPVLTVVLSVWWVPGVRMTGRLGGALALAVAGLALANLSPIHELLSPSGGAEARGAQRFLPYVLALVAAVTWAIYSAVLARWKAWAGNYVTSPVGFIVIGLVAAVILWATGGTPAKVAPQAIWLTVLYGIGPLAGGYLLWELALTRARVQTLGLTAAAIPVLSTLLLCCFLRKMPGAELLAAALLVSAGVGLSRGE
jgi:drug/metabolite transporter (DMT)-like permease